MHSPTDWHISRSAYHYFLDIPTRWIDNDAYGHVNNAVYYTWFDTVTVGYLIERGGLDFQHADVVGFIVASSCQYRQPIAYPQVITAGLRVNRLSRRSVEYGIGIFPAAVDEAAAYGTFTHVFVNRQTGRSTEIPERIRTALAAIEHEPEPARQPGPDSR